MVYPEHLLEQVDGLVSGNLAVLLRLELVQLDLWVVLPLQPLQDTTVRS